MKDLENIYKAQRAKSGGQKSWGRFRKASHLYNNKRNTTKFQISVSVFLHFFLLLLLGYCCVLARNSHSENRDLFQKQFTRESSSGRGPISRLISAFRSRLCFRICLQPHDSSLHHLYFPMCPRVSLLSPSCLASLAPTLNFQSQYTFAFVWVVARGLSVILVSHWLHLSPCLGSGVQLSGHFCRFRSPFLFFPVWVVEAFLTLFPTSSLPTCLLVVGRVGRVWFPFILFPNYLP